MGVRLFLVTASFCTMSLVHVSAVLAQGTWQTPRTADGQPDLSGIWANNSATPLQRPEQLAGKATLSDEELAELNQRIQGFRDAEQAGDLLGDRLIQQALGDSEYQDFDVVTGNYNAFWLVERELDNRTSLIVDPPNGRVPLRESAIAARNANLVNLTDGWLEHTPWERCITRGIPGGMFPGGYGAGYQIMQAPGYVVIFYEMIHEARVIPLGDRPALSENIRLWNGDPRGYWEGTTLVVETANYNDQGTIGTNIASRGVRGIKQSEALKIVERFSFVDADTLHYEVTIDDPEPFTAPWKVAMPLNRDSTYQIFEYACHEGNYGLENSLRAGRAEDSE